MKKLGTLNIMVLKQKLFMQMETATEKSKQLYSYNLITLEATRPP